MHENIMNRDIEDIHRGKNDGQKMNMKDKQIENKRERERERERDREKQRIWENKGENQMDAERIEICHTCHNSFPQDPTNN